MARRWRRPVARFATAAIALGIWFSPPPSGLELPAWRLFAIFAAVIFAVVAGALPLLTASVLAVGTVVLTGILRPAEAYSGFANGTILLIVTTFLVASAVEKCGLGTRMSAMVVSLFGRSTLGLSYSIFVFDALIAPAFPSNTARSGVIYPVASSLAEAAGAKPGDPSRRRLGLFLMFSGMTSISLSSTLWLTAMAGNPVGAEIARTRGVDIGFTEWLVAASVPTLVAIAVQPLVLYWLIKPEVRATPEAPAAARRQLQEMGSLSTQERIVVAVFGVMVALWASAASLGLDSTAIAFLGLGVLLVTGTLTLGDIAKQGDVLATFIWFAVLFTLSGQLDRLGFMGFVGKRLAIRLGDLAPFAAGVTLVIAYAALHYLFVSQNAHLLALFAVFLDVGIKLGVNPAILALELLFATNYVSVLTPQAASANLLFVGSGYVAAGDAYRLGAITVAISLLIFLAVGIPWLALVAR
jgi:DASS family divalent anion:Na+ symporter